MAFNMVELAEYVAEKAHFGQVDKAGVDYINHPKAVSMLLEGEKEKICAYLHDVLEDTDFSEQSLRTLFGDEIVDVLLILTHDKNESYEDYIMRIATSPIARAVKIADLTHNSDLSRLKSISNKDIERYNKYQSALEKLKN